MRLINANDLSDEVEKSKRHNPHFDGAVRRTHNHEHDHFLRMIDDSPTIDAVPVVRCGDCAHVCDYGEPRLGCTVWDGPCDADDFCSYGKRKEGIN